MLATDAASSIGGRLEGSNEIGIVQGMGRRGGPALKFQLLDSTVAMEPGQRIVSFGSQGDRPYVPGVPIGTITKIERTPGSLTPHRARPPVRALHRARRRQRGGRRAQAKPA